MSSTAQLARVILPSSAQPAEHIAVMDQELEHRLYLEAVCAVQGCDFDEAVIGVYSYRPERELPRAGLPPESEKIFH